MVHYGSHRLPPHLVPGREVVPDPDEPERLEPERPVHVERDLTAGRGRRQLDKPFAFGQSVADRIVQLGLDVEAETLASVLVVVFRQLVERRFGPEDVWHRIDVVVDVVVVLVGVGDVVGVLFGRGQRLDLEAVASSSERRLVGHVFVLAFSFLCFV